MVELVQLRANGSRVIASELEIAHTYAELKATTEANAMVSTSIVCATNHVDAKLPMQMFMDIYLTQYNYHEVRLRYISLTILCVKNNCVVFIM